MCLANFGDLIQIRLHLLELPHVTNGGVALIHHQTVVKMGSKQHKRDQNWNNNDGGRYGGREAVVPELHPAQNRHLEHEQEQPQNGGERPRELDKAPHSLVRTFRDQFADFELGNRLDVRQNVRGNHQGENMDRNQHCRADRKHDEEPLGDICWRVDLQLHLQNRNVQLSSQLRETGQELTIAIIANPESSSEVVAVAFSLARDLCSRLQDRPSGVLDSDLRPFLLVSMS